MPSVRPELSPRGRACVRLHMPASAYEPTVHTGPFRDTRGHAHAKWTRRHAHRDHSALPGRIQPPCNRQQCSPDPFRQFPGHATRAKTPYVCVLILAECEGVICAPHLPGVIQSLGSGLLTCRELKRKHARFFAKAGPGAMMCGRDPERIGAA